MCPYWYYQHSVFGRLFYAIGLLSVTLVYSGQTVGWIKMPLGTEVGLNPGDIPSCPVEGVQQLPTFRPIVLWHGLHLSNCLMCWQQREHLLQFSCKVQHDVSWWSIKSHGMYTDVSWRSIKSHGIYIDVSWLEINCHDHCSTSHICLTADC